jgi:L-asparaginase
MLKAGVLSGKDITSEASVTKLMHLLGTISDRKQLISSINRSLAGEIA